jgi:hypothetical protein
MVVMFLNKFELKQPINVNNWTTRKLYNAIVPRIATMCDAFVSFAEQLLLELQLCLPGSPQTFPIQISSNLC